ncbi:MAG TPA: metallophosphoesterase, partial [Thermoanaerobaculia bacterium]|nr:metallophosphoesterase [Thermoanaerobaculia bacterium]
VALAAAALVAERQPDLVLLSGDLTQRAKPAQFREARRFVDGLARPALVVPGNHDVPLYRFWERLFAPFGAYRRHFARELEPEYRDEELAVVGVNTAHAWTLKGGRVRRGQLARLAASFAETPPDRCRIVVAHHQLVPAPGARSRSSMRNARAAAAAYASAGVELVVSGHLHEAFVMRSDEAFPGLGEPFLLVHCGTTTSDRGRGPEQRAHSCTWIEVDREAIALSTLRYDPRQGRFAEHQRHRFVRRRSPARAAGDIMRTGRSGSTEGRSGDE